VKEKRFCRESVIQCNYVETEEKGDTLSFHLGREDQVWRLNRSWERGGVKKGEKIVFRWLWGERMGDAEKRGEHLTGYSVPQ